MRAMTWSCGHQPVLGTYISTINHSPPILRITLNLNNKTQKLYKSDTNWLTNLAINNLKGRTLNSSSYRNSISFNITVF